MVRIATMSALLVVCKLAFAFAPNIEVVTTLTMVFGSLYGYSTLVATTVFCMADMIIYPFSIDVAISYFIYWNTLALISAIIGKRTHLTWVYIIVGAIGTVVFHLITSTAYVIVFRTAFLPTLLASVPFCIVQIVSTTAFTLVGYRPLYQVLMRFK